MATTARIDDKQMANIGDVDVGYVEWKRAKIEPGLAQSLNCPAMHPVEQMLRNLTV